MPTASVDAVVDALRARLAERVVVGDPRAEGVTMGPLASLEQRDEVLRQVGKLVDAGGELVIGSTRRRRGRRTPTARAALAPDGAFVTPMMLRFADSGADAVHEVEAFGPVSSIFGYDTVDRGRRPRRARRRLARDHRSRRTTPSSRSS